jgi:lipoate-protein ligase B
MCREFRIAADRNPDHPGIWARGGQLAFFGAAVKSSISSQGVFVNVNPRMDALRLVQAGTGRVTSLAAERRVLTSMGAVRESLIRNVAARLEYPRYHLYTGHPLLRRTRRVVAYA